MMWRCTLARASGSVTEIEVDISDPSSIAALVSDGGTLEVLRAGMPAGRLFLARDADQRRRPVNYWATDLYRSGRPFAVNTKIRGDALFVSESDFQAAERARLAV